MRSTRHGLRRTADRDGEYRGAHPGDAFPNERAAHEKTQARVFERVEELVPHVLGQNRQRI